MTPSASVVAAAALDAVHRRDHHHGQGSACRPHHVEEIDLGRDAAVVCHDCGWTRPWDSQPSAAAAVVEHRRATA